MNHWLVRRSWLLAVAAINVIVGLDSGRFPPYFSHLIWRGLYATIALLLVCFYLRNSRNYFLWACTLITANGFMRGVSFFISDQRFVPLAVNLNVIILTWMLYRETVPPLPAKETDD